MLGVSRRINNPVFIQTIGKPSTITTSETHIIIGTHYGYILLFNHKQELQATLCSSTRETDMVSSIALSDNRYYILVAHESGKVVLWNLKQKTPVVTIPQSDQFKRVTNIKFLDGNNEDIFSVLITVDDKLLVVAFQLTEPTKKFSVKCVTQVDAEICNTDVISISSKCSMFAIATAQYVRN